MTHPHVTKAAEYIDDVIAGTVPACKWIKLACQRQLRDLERQGTDDFRFVFDADLAERVCSFMSRMPHVKGEWAQRRECISLEPWQCFILTTVFGWLHDGTGVDNIGNAIPAGTRRFRTAYQETARKNAKTTQGAGLLNYMLAADGEEGAEVYSAACTRKQAGISFQIAKAQAKRAAGFLEHYGIQALTHRLVREDSNSFMEPLHAEGETLDGLNIHFALVDEVHAHPTRKVYDVLESSTGSRQNSLLFCITTAGFNTDGICYELREYSQKVLDGTIADDTFFAVIYTLDDDDLKDDRWTDPAVWIKANPNYGVSVYPFEMERLCRKAQETPTAQVNFKTKRLNVWCNAETAWMNMLKWRACADTGLHLDHFNGERCWIGMDLATKVDICAVQIVFRREDHFYTFGKFYLPEETIESSVNSSHYQNWKRQGLLTVTPGNVTDYAYIRDDLVQISQQFEVAEVCFDPFQATQLSTELQDEHGLTMVEVRPTVLNFSEPMKEVEALVLQNRLHHDGNECLAWQISNVCVQEDRKGNIYPRRPGTNINGTGISGRHKKIDAAVALVMAMKRAMVDEDKNASIYDTRGVLSI